MPTSAPHSKNQRRFPNQEEEEEKKNIRMMMVKMMKKTKMMMIMPMPMPRMIQTGSTRVTAWAVVVVPAKSKA